MEGLTSGGDDVMGMIMEWTLCIISFTHFSLTMHLLLICTTSTSV